MPALTSPIRMLPGVGPAVAEKFSELGLTTLQDCLFYFPIRYEDWRHRTTIDQITYGQAVTLFVAIERVFTRRARNRALTITEAKVSDASKAKLTVVWFNQPYLAKRLRADQQLFLSGEVTDNDGKLQLVNPMYEPPTHHPSHEQLQPVYRTTEGLSQRQIRKAAQHAVQLVSFITDPLPPSLRQEYQLMGKPDALRFMHFPTTPELAQQALYRLKFEELLIWHLGWRFALTEDMRPASPIGFHEEAIRSFVQHLPFELTSEQRLAAWQMIQDMATSRPMCRLLQGDVGTGKTVVAAIAAYDVILNQHQVILLAPTVILAEQHWQTLTRLFQGKDITIGLLTSDQARVSTNSEPIDRTVWQAMVAAGEVHFVIATQAALATPLVWDSLGLIIVDEQQRFGIDQRQQLLRHEIDRGHPTPHFASLSATPIPRTLGLFLAGVLHISTIKHKPPGHATVTTEVIEPDERRFVEQAVAKAVDQNEQVFIITPLIEESDALGVRAATVEYDRWRKKHPKWKIGLIHGSIPAKQRIEILDQFRRGKLTVLVSTTVIEVGIDIPRATLIVIEGAERFGLAQLHQLRGRVGRHEKAGHCLLVTDQDSADILERLKRFATVDNGFDVAELDLQLRGVGEFTGHRQSGLPDWRLVEWQDSELFALVRQAADQFFPNTQSIPPELVNRMNKAAGAHRE